MNVTGGLAAPDLMGWSELPSVGLGWTGLGSRGRRGLLRAPPHSMRNFSSCRKRWKPNLCDASGTFTLRGTSCNLRLVVLTHSSTRAPGRSRQLGRPRPQEYRNDCPVSSRASPGPLYRLPGFLGRDSEHRAGAPSEARRRGPLRRGLRRPHPIIHKLSPRAGGRPRPLGWDRRAAPVPPRPPVCKKPSGAPN